METEENNTQSQWKESWFLGKINKMETPLAKMTKENFQRNKIRDEKGEIKTVATKIWRIIRKYFENLYFKTLENMNEVDKFLGMHNQIKPRTYK